MLLLDAAVRVVGEQGVGALTHRAVAAGAVVSLASVTCHYPSIDQCHEVKDPLAVSRHQGE
ncbi:TetR family transcriptional regulator [Streptomyces phaeochromogenes]|uniref:TetR family transcriptional regulator n=1 Tax=Streptomyces phaeochromogenes TaxID=1923 RepID=UPI0033EB4D7F